MALNQNDMKRQNKALENIGLLSAVLMAVDQPSQFVFNGPLTLSPLNPGVQVSVERVQVGLIADINGGFSAYVTGFPQPHSYDELLRLRQADNGKNKVSYIYRSLEFDLYTFSFSTFGWFQFGFLLGRII